MTLGEIYIFVTDSEGNTLAGVREDIYGSITSKRLSRSLRNIIDDHSFNLNILMEAQRILDSQLRDSKGQFKKIEK